MQTILAVDDETGVRHSYRVILSDRYHVLLAQDGPAALKLLGENHVDLLLVDLLMPGMSGLDLLQEIRQREAALPVIVVTALNAVAPAVEAMKRGAREYLIKPFDVEQLLIIIERVLSEQKNARELLLRREADARGFESLIGTSPTFLKTLDLARVAMQVDSTVLLTGDSGTGKDLLARAIHSGGKRAKEAFVPLSCCAIPATLVESELFGHERGAFTGATERRAGKLQIADRGTLFLDEIGEMPLEAQVKLLRVLQDGAFYPVGSTKLLDVDVRIICATNRDLPEAVARSEFREDLFYRINVLPIELPPLRKRREDIPELVAHFVEKHAPLVNARTQRFDPEALGMLTSYSWPGNVRELENVVHRTLVHHGQAEAIRPEHLRGILTVAPPGQVSEMVDLEGLPIEEATQRLERHLIMRALERSGYVQSRAAELLHTTRRILKYKMDNLQIPAQPDSSAQKESE